MKRDSPLGWATCWIEAFIHHRSHTVEKIQIEIGFRVADRFDAFECASAGEDGEAPKKFLFGGAEEVIAPVDCGAQSLLTLRKVASATGEQLQAAGEACAHGGDGENLHARGCEFDREGQAVQAAADFDDGG